MMIPAWIVVIALIAFIVLSIWLISACSSHSEELSMRKGFQRMFRNEKAKRKEDRQLRTTLEERVCKLEDAIKEHMHAKGHNRCWLNDLELYQVINPEFDKMGLALPCLPEFMHNCSVYWRDSQPPEVRKLGG